MQPRSLVTRPRLHVLPLFAALSVTSWCIGVNTGVSAQEWSIEESTAPETTTLEYVATEGTWISLDISPDGRHIVFDLLGHIYEMPSTGGDATPLTEGRSWNAFPKYSPGGRR